MLERCAELAVAQRAAPLRPSVSHAALRTIVDWMAATVPGGTMTPPTILTRALVDEAETGKSRLVPSGRAVRLRTAALVNGTASHAAELDDIYRDGIYHPGSPTIAAALAAAEYVNVSGVQLLRAITVGYEIGCRIAAAVQPAHYQYWHTTGTIGTIGAAAAAADLLELDERGVAHALATATTTAAGLQQAFRSDAMSKPLHAGHAAEAGALAALAAGEGLTGALDVLDGPAGFGAAMAAGVSDWGSLARPPAEEPCIAHVTVKIHSCCGHTFAPVDAALRLRERGVRPADVARIHVYTYATAKEVAGNPDPRTAFEAKFSTPYCVAAAMVLGTVRLRAFADDALHDTTVRDLAARTDIDVDPEIDARYPRQRAARVRVVLHDGSELVEARYTRKGDPDDPVSDAELRAKFDELVSPIIGNSGATALADGLWQLPQLSSVRDLEWLLPHRAKTS